MSLPDSLRQQVEWLLRDGHSDLEIHRRTGVARATAARYRRSLGLPGYQTTADSPTCRHGHAFPENLGRDYKGHLICVACVRISNRAACRKAYRPAQLDEVAIQRAAAGDPPDLLTPRERQAAIAHLDRQELPAAVIAEHVGCSPRTVHRARQRAAA